MVALVKYETWQKHAVNGGIDWDSGNVKLMISTVTYSPSATTHEFKDDVTNEVSGTGYTAGGSALGSPTVAEASGVTTVDAADLVFTYDASGFTDGRIFVLYYNTGTPATSPLIAYGDNGASFGNGNGTVTFQWNGSGIFTQT